MQATQQIATGQMPMSDKAPVLRTARVLLRLPQTLGKTKTRHAAIPARIEVLA